MIIDTQANSIILRFERNSLKRYHLSQFSFYGFNLFENEMILETDNLSVDFYKVLNYLEKENIEYDKSESAAIYFEELKHKDYEFSEIFSTGKQIKDGIFSEKSFRDFKMFLKKLPRKLKSHQVKAAYHLYSIKNGANFSVPGSGKTSVVVSVYEKLKSEGECNLIFVVGPPSSFQPWQDEFNETTGRTLETKVLSGGPLRHRKSEYYSSKHTVSELYLSTFQTLMNDCDDLIKFLKQEGINAFFVVDEAHYMKQVGGSWADSLLKVARFTKYRCVLTGTPMPKSYTDIFNLFDFLWQEKNPLTDEIKIKIDLYEKSKRNEEAKELLRESIGPLFYRVRKKDLGLKPAIFHPPALIKMGTYENRIYQLLKSKIFELSKTDFFKNKRLLEKLWKGRVMRMRQSLSYPKLLLTSIENYDENIIEENSELLTTIRDYDNLELPGKLTFLVNMVVELLGKNQKILIWSNFIGTIELIKKQFDNLQLSCEVIYGKTPTKKNEDELSGLKTREEIRDLFVDPNSQLDILIANPAACAESISLHKTCFHAIYYDLSYNCAQYLQSLDRIHRVGGSETHTANYYFLQYEDSIDDDIKANLDMKAMKMYDIVDEDYNVYNLDMFEDSLDDDFGAYNRIFNQN